MAMRRPPTVAVNPRPGWLWKSLSWWQGQTRGAGQDGSGQRVLAAGLRRGGKG